MSFLTFPQELKQATAISHQELEDLAISKSLLSADVEITDYLNYLQSMEDIIVDVENQVFPYLENEISQLNERRKVGLIAKDLAVLNSQKRNPISTDIWVPGATKGFAMGIFYVIEGSSLGGRVIYKHVQKKLGLDAENGAAFFYGYAENTGTFWKEFLMQLVSFEEQNGAGSQIIAGANHAFEAIKRRFQQNVEY